MAQLRRQADAFKEAGGRVVLVGLGSLEDTAAFKSRFDVPFAMIADPQKQLFNAFQLKQAGPKDLLSLGMAAKGLSAMFRGHHVGIPKGDVRQLPGVFIIDTGGRICFSHYARNPADHPPAEDVLARVRATSRPRAPA